MARFNGTIELDFVIVASSTDDDDESAIGECALVSKMDLMPS